RPGDPAAGPRAGDRPGHRLRHPRLRRAARDRTRRAAAVLTPFAVRDSRPALRERSGPSPRRTEMRSDGPRTMVSAMSDSSLPDRSEMRASDADRDRVAARLREALAEGRLTPDEHSERLDAVYNSKTLGELAPLLRDLPETPDSADLPLDSPRPVYGRERVVDAAPDGHFSLALMGA